MNSLTPAQRAAADAAREKLLDAAATEIAVDLGIDAARLDHYCAIARAGGAATRAEQLASVRLADDDAPPGPSGVQAADPLHAAICGSSQASAEREAGYLRSEIRRRCAQRGCWWQQCQDDDAPPRDPRAFARWVARSEAHRRFPGATPAIRQRRVRWVRKWLGPLHDPQGGAR